MLNISNMLQGMEGLRRATESRTKDEEENRWRESINPGSSSHKEDGLLASLNKKISGKIYGKVDEILGKLEKAEQKRLLEEPTEEEKAKIEEYAEQDEKEEENRSIFVKVASEFLRERVIKIGKGERVPVDPNFNLRYYDFTERDVLELKDDDLEFFASNINLMVGAFIENEVLDSSLSSGDNYIDYSEEGDREKIREMVEEEARKMIPVRQERLRTKKSVREEQDAQKIEELRIQIQSMTGFRGAQGKPLEGENIPTVVE